MRVVLDTNILLSGLMSSTGTPGRLLNAWLDDRFTLVSSEEQLREFRRASRCEQVAKYISQSDAGTLVNTVRALAIMVERLPVVNLSPDPHDDFLLAIAQAGGAHYLVSGDKSGLLALGKMGDTKIVTAGKMAGFVGI
ncbi:MAG: putative toxin-antitoxin system toxin component, PIN family [Sulfuricellaceae bacterium]